MTARRWVPVGWTLSTNGRSLGELLNPESSIADSAGQLGERRRIQAGIAHNIATGEGQPTRISGQHGQYGNSGDASPGPYNRIGKLMMLSDEFRYQSSRYRTPPLRYRDWRRKHQLTSLIFERKSRTPWRGVTHEELLEIVQDEGHDDRPNKLGSSSDPRFNLPICLVG